MLKVLIIDDGIDITNYCGQFISEAFEYTHIKNGINLKHDLKKDYDLILLDKNFAKCSAEELLGPQEDVENEGLRILRRIKEIGSKVPVIMVTAHADYDSAAMALRLGAFDYVEWDAMQKDFLFLKTKMLRALDWALKSKDDLIKKYNDWGLIGKSDPMVRLFQNIDNVLNSDSNVFLSGPTGVGKDLVAKIIHYHGKRKDKPFVSVNCPAISKYLLESELFGHEKGAFTDATKKYEGRFKSADKGTIFLNEIGDLPLELQVKLLKVIEEKKIEPVGSSVSMDVDVRIISATNQNIEDLIPKGLFREDLYYRLNVLKIEIPSLKERKEDLSPLIDFFIKKKSENKQKEIVGITYEARKYLEQKEWSGNVRQLENLLESAFEKADRVITLSDLIQEKTLSPAPKSDSKIPCSKETPKDDCPIFGELNIDQIEKIAIISALKSCGGCVEPACEKLGISKANMYNKINLYKLKDFVKGYGLD